LKAKVEKLDGKQRLDAERVATQRNAAVAQVIGGAPELAIPVVESSSDVICAARAEIERRLARAEDNEAEPRAQYWGVEAIPSAITRTKRRTLMARTCCPDTCGSCRPDEAVIVLTCTTKSRPVGAGLALRWLGTG
jgi:hypothetical protein